MSTYREQLEILKPIKLSDGQTRRMNCPFCGGTGTFSISRKDGARVWNCYKASCGVRGGTGTDMTIDGIRNRLSGDTTQIKNYDPIPEHLSMPRSHDKVIAYLRSVGSLEAFEKGLVDVRFSPQQNRVLFFMNDRQGAVGRALDKRKPKWRVYGSTEGLFKVGSGRTAIVVEDAASACSVGVFTHCSGCALLGTSLSSLQKQQLITFDEVVIALDADASRKAIRLQGRLEGRVNTRVVYLSEDLKYLTKLEIERAIGHESTRTYTG